MNRKIAMSMLSIVGALTILSGATYAVLSDSVTTTANTFAVGSADLQIAPDAAGNPGVFAKSIAGPTFNGVIPGQTKNFDFWLKNSSSSAVPLDLVADVSAINDPNDGAQTIDNTLLVSWLCDTDGNNSLADNTPTSEFSPRDWLVGGNASLGTLPANTQMFCRMIGRLPSSADNTVAGQTFSFDVKYDGTQSAI